MEDFRKENEAKKATQSVALPAPESGQQVIGNHWVVTKLSYVTYSLRYTYLLNIDQQSQCLDIRWTF